MGLPSPAALSLMRDRRWWCGSERRRLSPFLSIGCRIAVDGRVFDNSYALTTGVKKREVMRKKKKSSKKRKGRTAKEGEDRTHPTNSLGVFHRRFHLRWRSSLPSSIIGRPASFLLRRMNVFPPDVVYVARKTPLTSSLSKTTPRYGPGENRTFIYVASKNPAWLQNSEWSTII